VRVCVCHRVYVRDYIYIGVGRTNRRFGTAASRIMYNIRIIQRHKVNCSITYITVFRISLQYNVYYSYRQHDAKSTVGSRITYNTCHV